MRVSIGAFDCPLEVAIANDHTVSDSSVYHGCVLEIFGADFPIDLVPILMGKVCMIAGMDWSSQFRF